tara:strand:+ start:238 stop:2148 length:1911 start_codon:yes stop_codon:yes gene_type:complete
VVEHTLGKGGVGSSILLGGTIKSVIIMKKNSFLKHILNNLISEEDLFSLSLDKSNDNFSKICRSFILQFYSKYSDNKKSIAILESEENSSTLNLFKKFFFNIDKNIISKKIKHSSNNHIWNIFCPEAFEASRDPDKLSKQLLKKRKLENIKESKETLVNPSKEILFSSNVLITTPIDFSSPNIPDEIKSEVQKFKNINQSYWYDHPIPLDALKHENEIIYGLENLDRAITFEIERNNINKLEKITLVLSVSVTHKGLEEIALKYLRSIIKKNLNLRHLDIFLFNENTCKKMSSILFHSKDNTNNTMGVNGNYGRHFTFLKYILLIWNKVIDSNMRYSFKIDLDQIFDQEVLIKTTGFSIFEIFKNQKYWGGTATDYEGNKVDLGLLAGALVNKKDISKGLHTPDVNRPESSNLLSKLSSKRIFCPEWPQSLSTETELMYNSNDIQRIHVTGGTTGITLDSIKKWAPFTPSFINRAEDQAFGISSINQDEYLSHCHGESLIMRHDKNAFATKSIEMSRYGKEIGNLERILLFSYYAQNHKLGYNKLKQRLWPFTSSFITKYPELLTGLIFLIDGCFNGGEYVSSGSKRLLDTHLFCKTKLNLQLQKEKNFWKEFIDRFRVFKDSNSNLKSIIYSNKL